MTDARLAVLAYQERQRRAWQQVGASKRASGCSEASMTSKVRAEERMNWIKEHRAILIIVVVLALLLAIGIDAVHMRPARH